MKWEHNMKIHPRNKKLSKHPRRQRRRKILSQIQSAVATMIQTTKKK
jgi:hypothetical protein